MVAVSVVVVTMGQGAQLTTCLTSLTAQTFRDFEVITVVNGAASNFQLENAVTLVQQTRLVFTGSNVGYGAACNVGAKAANGSILLFLNDDTVLQPECLSQIHGLLSRERACITQPLIFHEYASVWRRGNPCDVYGAAGVGFYRGCGTGEFFASGACLSVGKHTFQSLGGFDEILFLYHDDVDLCWRARLRGIKISSAPEATCVHAGGESSTSMPHPVKFYYTQRNRFRVLIKNYSVRRLLLRLPVAVSLIIAGATFLSLNHHSPKYILKAFNALFWNIAVIQNTIAERRVVQSTRVVGDAVIEDAMSEGSMDLCVLRRHLTHGNQRLN